MTESSIIRSQVISFLCIIGVALIFGFTIGTAIERMRSIVDLEKLVR